MPPHDDARQARRRLLQSLGGAAFAAALPATGLAATAEERVARYQQAANRRLGAKLYRAGFPEYPYYLSFVAIKDSARLEIYARDSQDARWAFVTNYPILAMSGELGPKLVQGDKQVPEGRYRVLSLNPNSAFHLALRLNYPNEWDRARAQEDGRGKLGGDIMIHGTDRSAGCLAMGDPAAEDLFVAAYHARQVDVLICPHDFREDSRLPRHGPAWTTRLYRELREELRAYA